MAILHNNRKILLVFFLCGLALRLGGIFKLSPTPILEWFAPFMVYSLQFPTLDPWTCFLQNGSIKAFPYGIVMFIVLLPLSGIAYLLNSSLASVGGGISATLIIADVAILALLRRILPNRDKLLLFFWWISPLVLMTNVWIGQLDVIPVALLFACIFCIKKKNYKKAALFLSMALSAKLSMALAIPFVLLYFLRNKRMWHYVLPFIGVLSIFSIVLLGLPLLSPGYSAMTLGSSEFDRLFDLYLNMGTSRLYLAPVLYLLVVYNAWRTPFLSFELLTAFIALGMLTIVLSTPTPPGWQLWTWPFLLLHLANCELPQKLLAYLFSLCVAVAQMLYWPSPLNINEGVPPLSHGVLYDVTLTVIVGMGAILMLGILRNSIRANAIYRFSKKPISIAVAGDSGAGKDTLVESITEVLGPENVAHISGDDYHYWDRKNASWQLFTHLNPRANNLKRLFADVNNILDGKKVIRRHYQHTDGRFSQPFSEEPQHFFIASGLHMLISQVACARFDVRVFLEMEDELRMYFKFRRDSNVRGHSVESIKQSIERRKPDGERYIIPQRERADIVFMRCALNPKTLDFTSSKEPATLLIIKVKHSLYHEELVRLLISLCGIRVDVECSQGMDEVTLTVDGDIRGEDMSYIASKALPEFEELIAVNPVWRDGAYGLMQLVILFHLSQKLKART